MVVGSSGRGKEEGRAEGRERPVLVREPTLALSPAASPPPPSPPPQPPVAMAVEATADVLEEVKAVEELVDEDSLSLSPDQPQRAASVELNASPEHDSREADSSSEEAEDSEQSSDSSDGSPAAEEHSDKDHLVDIDAAASHEEEAKDDEEEIVTEEYEEIEVEVEEEEGNDHVDTHESGGASPSVPHVSLAMQSKSEDGEESGSSSGSSEEDDDDDHQVSGSSDEDI